MANKVFYALFLFLALSQEFTTLVQSDTYIVQMDVSVMPKAYADHHSWYTGIIASLLSSKLDFSDQSSSSSKLVYSYSHALHGFSACLTPSELETLKSSPGYISSIRDLPVKTHTTHSSQFLGLNAINGAWQVANYGKDVIIGVVDSGVWPESPSYRDDGMTEIPSRWKGKCEGGTQFNSSMCNKKLIGASFFNKGLIANNPGLNISMNSPRDTSGHGTHTSSTAAGNFVKGASFFGYANGTASGVAPRARVAMYKVSWDEGSFTSDYIAGMDRAIYDGVDVISVSLGKDELKLFEDPVAIASFAAMEKGIFVATSAGNDGPDIVTVHNAIPWVLTVAAGTMDRTFSGVVTLGNGVSISGTALFMGNSSGRKPLVFKDSCESSEELKKVGKKIVVCETNSTDPFSLSVQSSNVRDANVAGGIFISNISVDSRVSSLQEIYLTPENGEIIKSYIKRSLKPRANMIVKTTLLNTKPTPMVAKYSSRGPAYACPHILKPDLIAPGDLVLAAWPQNILVGYINAEPVYSEFNLLYGTSMSTPHAAGVAALLKGIRPKWSPAAIRSAMMTTADATDNTMKPIGDIADNGKPASPLALGAGHINPNKALDPGLIYDATAEDYVNFLCAFNFTKKQIQSVTRKSSYKCSKPSLDLNYPSFIAFFNDSNHKTSQEFTRTVTNVGDKVSNYTVNVTPISGFRISVVPSKLAFTMKYQKLRYKVRIESPRIVTVRESFGSLTWVETIGKHAVRSPIMIYAWGG